jgi:aminoglycoside phosphotransferase (APT) family kinase protein
VDLEACLPPPLRGAPITPLTGGLSGAGVFRVDADRPYVLKISDQPLDAWRSALAIRLTAARAGLSPEVIHTDEERRAIVTTFVEDRSFPLHYFTNRDAALALLGSTLRRLHELPLTDAPSIDPRARISELVDQLGSLATVPAFVFEATRSALDLEAPDEDRLVTSHNDVNPGNLIFDGERLLLLDWDVAGANEPYYDLAAIAVFLRMDDAACTALLAAYDGSTELPARFVYDRRVIAALCGATFLQLARTRGHAGEALSIEDTPTLVEFFQRMRTGGVDLRTPQGSWLFGLALAKASLTF